MKAKNKFLTIPVKGATYKKITDCKHKYGLSNLDDTINLLLIKARE
jgi:hypothetical protein